MTPTGHHEIAKACLPILEEGRPNDDFAYFYFGNWLTDVSQAIAPVDYAAAMVSVLQEGRKKTWVPNILADWKIDEFVKELLGDPPPRGSAMAQYFKDLIYVFGWTVFCRDPRRFSAGEGLIPFQEYHRIFHKRMTQYFPHEHLDRWPMDRTEPSSLGRRMYGYLERDLEYVAELLSLIERDWAAVDTGPGSREDRRRHDLLAEFGHAVHVVEDFFGHSNYVEFALRMLGRQLSLAPDDQRRFALRVLREKPPRTKTFDDSGNPVPPGRPVEEPNVVTGYFDSLDTRLSVNGLYSEMATKLQRLPGKSERDFVDLLDYRGQPLKEVNPVTGTIAEAHAHQQTLQWREDKVSEYSRLYRDLKMPEEVSAAHCLLISQDWRMMDRWDGMGVSAAIERMIKDGEEYMSMSFPPPRDYRYAERLGSHSLIAKDDPGKQPGYNEAMNLTKRVSRYIAEIMVRDRATVRRGARTFCESPQTNPNTFVIESWVDWLELLRYYCGHPAEAKPIGSDPAKPLYWWIEAIDNPESCNTGHALKYITRSEVDRRCELDKDGRLRMQGQLRDEHNSRIPLEVTLYNLTRN